MPGFRHQQPQHLSMLPRDRVNVTRRSDHRAGDVMRGIEHLQDTLCWQRSESLLIMVDSNSPGH